MLPSSESVGDADLNHLFGIKKPFQSPLFLSYPLNQERNLSVDEAAQICERDSAIKPTTRDYWKIEPRFNNAGHCVALKKMSKKGGGWFAEATWVLPLAPGEGQLRLSAPIGSGRALTKEETRQLNSFGGDFKGANSAWSVLPSERDVFSVVIVRYKRGIMLTVGSLKIATVSRDAPSPSPARTKKPFPAHLSIPNWIF